MRHALPDDQTVRSVIALALRAPSIHNSQPWRWVIGDNSVHLFADPDRQLPVADPDSRDLLVSCGAALHHLRVAFAAVGWATTVHRLPNPAQPDHLAAVECIPRTATAGDITLAAAISHRRTDRRRFSSWAVATSSAGHLSRARRCAGRNPCSDHRPAAQVPAHRGDRRRRPTAGNEFGVRHRIGRLGGPQLRRHPRSARGEHAVATGSAR